MRVGEWRLVALGDVLEIQHGFAFRGEFFDASGTDVLLTPKNFEPSGGIDVTDRRCKRYSGPTDERFVLAEGDIVVAMTDLKQDAPILGSTGVVPNGGKYLHNQRIGKVLIRDSDRLHRGFVPWLLNSPSVREGVRATATGATVRHTAPTRICAIRAPIPSIDGQRRIAAVLSAFDELIEINERRIELLEDLARSLYREWFVHFRFPGHEDVELVDSELGPIPEGWEVRRLDKLATLHRRSTKPANEPETVFEHFSIPAFDSGALPALEPGGAIKSAKYQVEVDAVLLSKINPKFPRVWFAQPRSVDAIASTEFLVWVGVDVSNAWLWSLFLDETFRRRLVGSAGGTSTSHQRFKPADVAGRSVALARATVLGAFDSLADPALRQAAIIREQNHQLAATRDLLLPRLVTGRLDISDIDLGILTPAEVE